MAEYKWFELSEVKGLRVEVEERLVKKKRLPPSKDEDKTAAAFWERVEKAGLLEEALNLYDELAHERVKRERANRERSRRESKKMFAERIEREGRRDEVERERKELLERGLSLRQIQNWLVAKFQPLDGSETYDWQTPDPWEAGRMFRKKGDYEKLLAEVDPDAVEEAKEKATRWRLQCAKFRRDERVALANARQRLWEIE